MTIDSRSTTDGDSFEIGALAVENEDEFEVDPELAVVKDDVESVVNVFNDLSEADGRELIESNCGFSTMYEHS